MGKLTATLMFSFPGPASLVGVCDQNGNSLDFELEIEDHDVEEIEGPEQCRSCGSELDEEELYCTNEECFYHDHKQNQEPA